MTPPAKSSGLDQPIGRIVVATRNLAPPLSTGFQDRVLAYEMTRSCSEASALAFEFAVGYNRRDQVPGDAA
jgi:hypothetical protein